MKYEKTKAILTLLVVFSIFSVCAGGTTVETVVTGLDSVWALEWGPDGSLYITERPGKVSKWNGDELVGLSEPPVEPKQ